MVQVINGPGNSLPPPQYLYPSELTNAPADIGNNFQGLAAGDALPIPSGSREYMVSPGNVSVIQWLDPVTGIWRTHNSKRGQLSFISSDGVTRRVANLTGCPIAAIVQNGGSGFTTANATIVATVGGSTWQAVVGGALSVTSVTLAGNGYGVTPLVLIPAPPVGGVQATAHAVLTGSSVSSIVLDNVGAGYPSAPTAQVLPNPTDPNIGTLTNATIVLGVDANKQGKITAALCTNNGAPLATLSALTLTAGGGTGAVLTPVIFQTITQTSIVAGGGGWGTAAVPAKIITAGGTPVSTSAIGNPAIEMTGYVPRDANITATTDASGHITAVSVVDSGLFIGTPTAAFMPGGTIPTTLASVALTMGATFDTVLLQPL